MGIIIKPKTGKTGSNMWTGIVGAGISALGALGSGLFGGSQARRSQKRQYEFNHRLQMEQQQWQRRMWELENLYNLPKNEVQRLLEAGVNPALAFSNGGASAAPIPTSGSAGGVSAPTSDVPNVGFAGVQAAQAQQSLNNDTAVSESVVERNKAEAEKLRSEASESSSRKSLNDIEVQIRSSPEYIEAVSSYPALRNQLQRLDYDMRDLDYQYSLGTYGYRMESAALGLDQQRLNYVSSVAQLRNITLTADLIGARINYLDAGSAAQREQARVLRQQIDIRAGSALLGTLQRDAIQYCKDHGIQDSVTGEIVSLTNALANEYANGVFEGIYSSKSSAVVSNQESVYQQAHGQERREFEQELVRRQGNAVRTHQWNESIRTGIAFLNSVIDWGATLATRGLNKAGGSLVTPRTGSERMPLSPEARGVLEAVWPNVEKRLIY